MAPEPVVKAVVDYVIEESRAGGYRLQSDRQEDVADYKVAAAELLGCASSEIAFASSGTAAWSAALNAVDVKPGDRVLATAAEYSSNVFGLIQLKQQGVEVELVPSDADTGHASVEALAGLMDERVKLVCVTHVPTDGGLVNPVHEIGQVLSEWPALYLLDACQSAGQLRLSVADIGCDFLNVTGRKFLRAPRGTGILFAQKGLPRLRDPQGIDLRSARWTDAWSYELADGAARFETFESSIAAKVGLGVALRYALNVGVADIADRVAMLSTELRRLLSETPNVELREFDGPQSGIVTFTVLGHAPEAVRDYLAANQVTVSATPLTNSTFDPSRRGQGGLVRASVHYYNTVDELERLAELVDSL